MNKIFNLALIICAAFSFVSCSDSKSYAEYLDDEKKACNLFLADQNVIGDIPTDSVFQCGPNAPFYKMTENGDVYMQVIKRGDFKNNKAADGQQIYFRFMRMNIVNWANSGSTATEGNAEDMGFNTFSFRFNNFELESSNQFGAGLQIPLKYLGLDCEVNLLIKSQYGFTSEISNVIPFLYKNVRYFKSYN